MSSPKFFRWPLGPLAKLDPAKLVPPDTKHELGELILVLALAFNDLKDFGLLEQFLEEHRHALEVTPRSGQWHGLLSHIQRNTASCLHELLYLLDKKRAILESDDFKTVRASIPAGYLEAWDELVDVAWKRGAETSALARIRNNGAFHYYSTKDLANAFRQWFYKDSKTPRNASAYVSFGRNMEASRFYFADAAAGRGLSYFAMNLDDGDIGKLLQKLLDRANLGIMGVLIGFVESRGGAELVDTGPSVRKKRNAAKRARQAKKGGRGSK